ncbi:MAG: Crp/Fnr family transcriptional regulator [Spiribacter sp.]|jgi:cAMP-binding proteins - catabolite gene activator and regulatory subunit of cAMP-dependent protein kinases|nr:Crp/Fnr family transcriptional regulator [Spiribacter sp.]MDR9480817.1 Crp/Fnr family transcriptional regulator [Spiribacter sp.]
MHPALASVSDSALESGLRGSRQMSMPAGTTVFGPGDICDGLPLLLKGEVRVQMACASGNEIVLYRIKSGDICALSLSCLISNTRHRAEAVVDEDTEVLVLPLANVELLMDEAPDFRRMVLQSYGQRLQSLMMVIEEVAFQRVDQRLAERLIERQRGGLVSATHHDLAVELGTAREVVSRLLKAFEHKGLVKLARGQVELADQPGLARVARPDLNGE